MTASSGKAGIYVHIPFCVQKCRYCSFVSGPSVQQERELYVEALMREIELRRDESVKADTVFFGGGTPSLLSAKQIGVIMDALHAGFDIEQDAEITLEANPATLSADKLGEYRSLGINRLSVGVQSMDDEQLRLLGRLHTSEDVVRDFALARENGFDNINADLIFAIPGTAVEDAIESLRRVVELEPEHISFYSLQLEEGTDFFGEFEAGRLIEVPDEVDREMYHRGRTLLRECGYIHYEISNFAGAGYESRHNSKYWDMSDYYGFGLSASSFVGGTRCTNSSVTADYRRMVAAGVPPYSEVHVNSEHDNVSEAVFTGLRRNFGIRYDEILGSAEAFWSYYSEVRGEVEEFVSQGCISLSKDGMELTSSGIDISNRIMALFV